MTRRLLLARLRAFLSSDRGSLSVEAVLVLPLLTWVYVGSFVFFDAFRAQSLNDKAAFAIADALSRETQTVNGAYIDSMRDLHRLMTFARLDTKLRVSVVRYDAADDRHYVVWSRDRGPNINQLQNSDLTDPEGLAAQIPMMSDGERLILVETWLPYEPAFNIGLDAFVFEGVTAISPRYAPQLCFDQANDGDPSNDPC